MPLYTPGRYQQGDFNHGLDPRDLGLIAMTFDPQLATTSAAVTSGSVLLHKVWWPRTATATNMVVSVAALAATPTANNNQVGIYSSAGTLLCSSADQGTWSATGIRSIPFTTATSIPGGPGVFVWLAVRSAATTPVSLHKGSNVASAAVANVGLTVQTARYAIASASAGVLPASITVASNAFNNGPTWLGVS